MPDNDTTPAPDGATPPTMANMERALNDIERSPIANDGTPPGWAAIARLVAGSAVLLARAYDEIDRLAREP